MNYTIIQNEQKLKEFINSLPDLSLDEVFYCALFARKKYCKEMINSSDKAQIKRFISTKNNLFNKIKQLEVEIGSYVLGDKIVPQESLAFYIMLNPRSQKKATKLLLKKLIDIYTEDNVGFSLYRECLSALQKNKSRALFSDFDFDIDKKEFEDIANKIKNFFGKDQADNCYKFLETRGGYHVIIEHNKIPKELRRSWYQFMRSLNVDIQGDVLTPVPGTYQGGFCPKFVNF